jgi:hypothetical protein
MDTEGGDPQRLQGRGVRFRSDSALESEDDYWLTPIGHAGAPAAADIVMPLNMPPFRWRMCASNEDGVETDRQIKLRYSHEGGSYLSVPVSSGDIIRCVATTWYATSDDATDYDSASDLWTGAWADADNNWLVEENTISGRCTFGSGQPKRMEGEWMLAIQPAGLDVDDTIHLRCYGSAETQFQLGYDCTPKITIAAAAVDASTWFIQHNRHVLSRILVR